MACQMFDLRRGRPGHPSRQRKQRRRGLGDIAFERRQGRHRIIIEVELMFFDQARQRLDWQAKRIDRPQQLGRDRIALGAPWSCS